MISVEWDGQLGNKMFQYALVYGASRRTGIPFCVEPWEGETYFGLADPRTDPSHRERWMWRGEPAGIRFDPDLLRPADWTMFHGYFQCERYFAEYREELLERFSLVRYSFPPYPKPILAVHSREGEYALAWRMREDYYRKAFEVVQEKTGASLGDFSVVLMSNNPESQALSFLDSKAYTRSNLSSLYDLALLSRADCCVIAASTFSWWGAWLNRNARVVVGPQKWFKRYGMLGPVNGPPEDEWFPADIRVNRDNWYWI